MRHNNYNSRGRKYAKYAVFAAIGIAFGAGFIMYPKVAGYLNRMALDKQNEEVMMAIIEENVLQNTMENLGEVIEEGKEKFEEQEVVILENAYLDVPFICQAPFQTEANWVYHEESCEEAAFLQVHYYLEGITEVDRQTAHNVIMDMIKWQEQNFGEHRDLYANDMKLFIRDYYGYEDEDIEIIYDAGVVDIKKAISAGYPVIVPIMGDVLQNPYYPYPGYHMLTVIGYTPEKIITNDVGTRNGADFSYTYEKFMKATKEAGGDILIIKKLPKTPVAEETTVE
ncbi:C39 family peptidase [Patescibacteria group bacterium]